MAHDCKATDYNIDLFIDTEQLKAFGAWGLCREICELLALEGIDIGL